MPPSNFRVAVEGAPGLRSEYGDVVLNIGRRDNISMYKNPRIVFYTRTPFTGTLALQGNDGRGFRDITTKRFTNTTTQSFGCVNWP